MEGAFKLSQIILVDCLRLHNQLPPERDALRALLQEVREKQAAVETLYQELCTKRAEYESYADALAEVLAPCRMVPADVWSVIFGYVPECCWEISWVCRGWREIALKKHSLWSDIPQLGDPVNVPSKFLWRLHAWIERAGNSPLEITMRLPLQFGFLPDDLEEFFAIFYAAIPRIGYLTLDHCYGMTLHGVLSFIASFPQNFNNLRQFKVNGRNLLGSSNDQLAPISLFSLNTEISKMVINTDSPVGCSLTPWLQVPWTNFTDLEMEWVSIQDMFYVVEHCPLLRELVVCTSPPESAEDHHVSKAIQHVRLRDFTWVCDNRSTLVCPDIFALLDLPEIKTIVLHSFYLNFNPQRLVLPYPDVTPARTFPHLTRLLIGPLWIDYDGDGYVKLLRTMPALEMLWLPWKDRMHLLFEALAISGTEGRLLPSLRWLRVTNVPGPDLMENGPLQWHTSLNQLARQRGNEMDDASEDEGLTIVLSGMVNFDAGSMGKIRRGAFLALNKHTRISDVEEAQQPSGSGLRSAEDPAKRIQELTDQLKKSSDKVDDVKYASARVMQKLELREALEDLLAHEASCRQFVEFFMPIMDDTEEMPPIFSELPKRLRGDRDAELLASRLAEKWAKYREEYLAAPGWNLIATPAENEEDTKACAIYYTPKRGVAVVPSEMLGLGEWGLDLDACGEIV